MLSTAYYMLHVSNFLSPWLKLHVCSGHIYMKPILAVLSRVPV